MGMTKTESLTNNHSSNLVGVIQAPVSIQIHLSPASWLNECLGCRLYIATSKFLHSMVFFGIMCGRIILDSSDNFWSRIWYTKTRKLFRLILTSIFRSYMTPWRNDKGHWTWYLYLRCHGLSFTVVSLAFIRIIGCVDRSTIEEVIILRIRGQQQQHHPPKRSWCHHIIFYTPLPILLYISSRHSQLFDFGIGGI